MKTFSVILLALGTQALKIKDLGDLDLPPIKDENDLLQDRLILAEKEKIESTTSQDTALINEFELQLNQGERNAMQGEMGRALAVSKLTSIKDHVNNLNANFKSEGLAIQE